MAAKTINDPTHLFVMDWMKKSGIDPNMVMTYTLIKKHGEPATIDLRMLVQDPPAVAVTSEAGPEMTDLSSGSVIHPGKKEGDE